MRSIEWAVAGLGCIIVLHTPDGSELRFESKNFTAVQAVPKGYKQHLAPGTKTIVYGTGGNKFGVLETPEDITALAGKCPDGGGGLNLDKSRYGRELK